MKIDRITRWISGAIMELFLKMIDKQTDTLSILDINIYRWLVKKGKAQKAYSVLKKVRHGVSESDIREEIADIEFTVQDSKSSSIIEIFRDLFRWRIFER